MPTIPTYSLYGVSSVEPLHDQLHFESIAQRSRLHDWEIQPHLHERFLQILYIHSGSGEALMDGERQPLRTGLGQSASRHPQERLVATSYTAKGRAMCYFRGWFVQYQE